MLDEGKMFCIYTAGLTTRGLFLVSIPDSITAIESVGSAFASLHATTRPVVPPTFVVSVNTVQCICYVVD